MDTEDLCYAGLSSIARFTTATLGRRGRAVLDEGGVVLCAGRNPSAGPWTNCAVRVDPNVSALDAWARAASFFGEIGHGFAFWTDDTVDRDLADRLRSHGAQLNEPDPVPGMAIDHAVAPTPHASGVTLVDDAQSLDELCEVVGVAYGFGSGVRGMLGDWPIDRSARAYVLRRAEGVAATAVAIRDVAGGVYMVGTAPDWRRKGYGEAVTAVVTNDLLADGLPAVVLQASAMGEPIYARMGYRTFTTYRRWVVPAPGVDGQS